MKLNKTILKRIVREAIDDPNKSPYVFVPNAEYCKIRAMEAIHKNELQLAIMLLAMADAKGKPNTTQKGTRGKDTGRDNNVPKGKGVASKRNTR